MFFDNYVRLCNSVNKAPSAVALEIGITKSTVSRWRAGSTPNYSTAQKVADYFGVSADEMLTGTPAIKEPPAIQEDNKGDDSYARLLAFLASSTPEERQQLINFADFIKSKRT